MLPSAKCRTLAKMRQQAVAFHTLREFRQGLSLAVEGLLVETPQAGLHDQSGLTIKASFDTLVV